MPIIARKFEFDYGHRIWGHESRCAFLHGHRGVAEVTLVAPNLDPLGRVIDFGVVKERIGKWIDQFWDHNFLVHKDDFIASMIPQTAEDEMKPIALGLFQGKKPFVMPDGMNPTAENMSIVLYRECAKMFQSPLKVIQVLIWETANCSASYNGEFE